MLASSIDRGPTLSLMALILATIVVSGCQSSAGRAAHPVPSGEVREVRAPAALPGITFAVRLSPMSRIQVPASYQLVAMFQNQIERTISRADDLVGLVEVADEHDVLQFARILSSDLTSDVGLADWAGWEITADGKLLDVPEAKLAPDIVLKAGCRDARVTKISDDQWEVERFVVKGDTVGPDRIIYLKEAIGSRGTYKVLESTTVYTGRIAGVPRRGRL